MLDSKSGFQMSLSVRPVSFAPRSNETTSPGLVEMASSVPLKAPGAVRVTVTRAVPSSSKVSLS